MALTAAVAVVGGIFSLRDTVLLVTLVAAAGLFWSDRERRAYLVAGTFVFAGLGWSSLDGSNCSAWWKGRIVTAKLMGNLPFLGWASLGHALTSPCYSPSDTAATGVGEVELLEEKVLAGQKCERYRTRAGDFWIPAPGEELLKFLIWEMMVQSDYESSEVAIRPGDTVIDAGAHIGFFAQLALTRGAGKVVAIEPDPTNRACLEANLAREIEQGKVLVVPEGIWDETSELTLSVSHVNSADSSFVVHKGGAEQLSGIRVRPLDDIVVELRLDRVDFIKMDIEGSEQRALKGASETLRRFRPRMAICAYHTADDPRAVSTIARTVHADYEVLAKDVNVGETGIAPKVLFFR